MLATGNQSGRRPFLQKLLALVGLSALPTRAQALELQTPPSHGNPPAYMQMVFTGIRGRVMALDRTKGDVIWNNRLGGNDFVNLLFAGGDLYAATRGELFCLNVDSGQIRWHNPLKGYGRGLMTITTAEVSGNQVAAMQAKLRKEKEAVVNASVHTGG